MSSCSTAHRTFVHHMALDPSGCLLASCSSDKHVNIFHRSLRESDSGDWILSCVLRDHAAAVTRVAWCLHRERGPLLASVSVDWWVYVYSINITMHGDRTEVRAEKCTTVKGYEKDAITDVAFLPPGQHHGLLLSTASLDGFVRVYNIQQPQQSGSLYKISPGSQSDGYVSARQNGITSIAWFPSSADETMTLALGCVNGFCCLYRFSKDRKVFEILNSVLPEKADAPIEHILWAPPMGRLFQLLVICSRSCVFIVRLNCISPAFECHDSKIFRWPHGAVCAAWSRSASLLYLVSDDETTKMTVLQASDPSDHESWKEVSQNQP